MKLLGCDCNDSGAYNIAHDIRVVALAQHADLLLDVSDLVPFTELYDLDGHKLSSGLEQGLVDRAIRTTPWRKNQDPFE